MITVLQVRENSHAAVVFKRQFPYRRQCPDWDNKWKLRAFVGFVCRRETLRTLGRVGSRTALPG
jgi:hypothetical protein